MVMRLISYNVETLLLLLIGDLLGLALRDGFTLRSGGRAGFRKLIQRIMAA
jgi:hypothetical protein